jgi:perosamine synthetase
MVPLFYPQIYKEEWLKELEKVFSTRWLGQGPKVDEFEQEFGKKFNYEYCLAVNSGTAALELAYHLIGIEEGDEVLTTVFTCTATNIPLLRREANIKFVDIGYDLVIDYNDLAKKISKKTKALVVVTLGGLPIDNRIFDLASHYNVPVVIDAAQSAGVQEKYGEYYCYSFQAIKHFTSIDGGMLVLKNEDEYQRAKKLRWFGIDREAKKRADWKCLVNHQMAMDIEEPGYKFHMNDVAATIGLVGLQHSDEILEYRKALCNRYITNLINVPVIPICGGSYWLFAILTTVRDDLIEHLKINNIESDQVQLRNDIFTIFGGRRQRLPNMNYIEDKYLYLPLNNKVTLDDVDYICEKIKEVSDK